MIREANASDSVFKDFDNRINFNTYNSSERERESKEKISRFLIDMYNARLMVNEGGKLARERGSTAKIRKYGNLMVMDQVILEKKIEDLAKIKWVVISKNLSEENTKALSELRMLNGESFDKKFTKMMKRDHRRDIRYLKMASKYEDKEISNFAEQTLPLIESHRRTLRTIAK